MCDVQSRIFLLGLWKTSRKAIEANKQMQEVGKISVFCRELLAKSFLKMKYSKFLSLNFCLQLGWKLESFDHLSSP